MPQPTKIEQLGLEKTVIDLYSQGLSTRQISDNLLKHEPPVSISYVSIAKYLEGVKAEAKKAATTVRQEHVRKKLPDHLAKLDAIIDDLYEEYQHADLKEKLAITRELRPTIELVIGRAPEDHGEMGGEDYLKEIECKLDSIVERRRKASIPQKPDPIGSEEAPV